MFGTETAVPWKQHNYVLMIFAYLLTKNNGKLSKREREFEATQFG